MAIGCLPVSPCSITESCGFVKAFGVSGEDKETEVSCDVSICLSLLPPQEDRKRSAVAVGMMIIFIFIDLRLIKSIFIRTCLAFYK